MSKSSPGKNSKDGQNRHKMKAKSGNAKGSIPDEIYELNEQTSCTLKAPSITQDDLIKFHEAVAPYLLELSSVKEQIDSSLKTVDKFMDKIREAFQGRMDIVRGASEVWEREQEQVKEIEEQAKEIEELTVTVRRLRQYRQEDFSELEAQIEALRETVETLQLENQNIEQFHSEKFRKRTKELEQREKSLIKEQEKSRKKLETERAEFKKKLEIEKKTQIDMLTKEVEELTRESTKLKARCDTLQKTVDKNDRAYANLEEDHDKVQNRLISLQEQFYFPQQPAENL